MDLVDDFFDCLFELAEGIKMRTLIHIGQHKTGTTSLQYYLQQNRLKLSKIGLYVADSIAGYNNPSHFILNVYALNKDRYSSMKERLWKIKSQTYFDSLENELKNDVYRHYKIAREQGCKDIIWSNEGLYLLNSVGEYNRLKNLFVEHSSSVISVCCFRDVRSYKLSYEKQLLKSGIAPSKDKDSYRYLEDDSWLFDYNAKIKMLNEVFDETINFNYNQQDNIGEFLDGIGYSGIYTENVRLNITQKI